MRFVLLLVAAITAIVAGVAALQLTKPSANQPGGIVPVASTDNQNVSTVDILVARNAIPLGAAIKEDMVDKQPWPKHLVLEGFIVSGANDADVIGKVARSGLQAREPLMATKLANPRDPSFLAANLRAGFRAITVGTDAISGVAGYVFPGDRVDLVLTHNIPNDIKVSQGGESASSKPAISEVMVPNVRVLAVNVRDASGKENNTPPSSVTVEVSDNDVERIRLAEKLGTISLSLRSVQDDNQRYPRMATMDQVTRQPMMGGAPVSSDEIRVVRGAGKTSSESAGKPAAPVMMIPAPAPMGGQ